MGAARAPGGPGRPGDLSPADEVRETLNGLPAPARLWLTPIRGPLAMVIGSKDKTLGDLTMPEVMAWGIIAGYLILSGVVGGRLAGNLAATVLRGPGVRR